MDDKAWGLDILAQAELVPAWPALDAGPGSCITALMAVPSVYLAQSQGCWAHMARHTRD